ncbi:MAG: thiolase family protein [Acidobacteriota bacterium]
MSPVLSSDIVLAGAVRTPIGRFGGALSRLAAPELGAIAVRASLKRGGLEPRQVSEVIFGNARSAGLGPNPARQVALAAGLPDTVPAFTINQACGSGMRTIVSAVQAVALGDADVVVAGGCESMSRVPYLLPEARWGKRLGHTPLVDGMYRDGFLCPLCGMLMGETAEKLADRYRISRDEQDTYAARSQNRAERARRAGLFSAEIVPVALPEGGGGEAASVEQDEHSREGVTAATLSRLPPVFRPGGTVHAGNSSGITDAGAALLVLEAQAARSLGVVPMGRVVGYQAAGVDPSLMGIGPVPAVRRLLSECALNLDQIDLVELNEAFAVQTLACVRDLDLALERVNVNGGAISLGHPIGATGARIVVTLLHEMARRRARRGLATLCVSGGLGLALLLESTA